MSFKKIKFLEERLGSELKYISPNSVGESIVPFMDLTKKETRRINLHFPNKAKAAKAVFFHKEATAEASLCDNLFVIICFSTRRGILPVSWGTN